MLTRHERMTNARLEIQISDQTRQWQDEQTLRAKCWRPLSSAEVIYIYFCTFYLITKYFLSILIKYRNRTKKRRRGGRREAEK